MTIPNEITDAWRAVLQRRLWPILILVLLWLAALIPYISRHGVPLPAIHDEFSYLLAGETFASGRLTNEPPPVQEAFQSFHILVEPTYMSKYLPGIGLQLALGFLLGHPIIGVWLTVLACAIAAFWMVEGFASRAWALFGGLLCLFQYGLNTYFAHSYWGGSLFMLAGFLVTGAFLRLLRNPAPAPSLYLGIGAGIMVLTRPVEGFFFAGTLVAVLLIRLLRAEDRLPTRQLQAILVPASLVGLSFLLFLSLQNRAVTGNPLRLPYVEYRAQYPTTTTFSWQAIDEDKADRMPEEFKLLAAQNARNRPEGFGENLRNAIFLFGNWIDFYIPMIWIIPVGVFLFTRRPLTDPLACSLWILILVKFTFPFFFKSAHHYHYFAAWAAPLLAAGIEGLRWLRQHKTGGEGRSFLLPSFIFATALFTAHGYLQFLTEKYGDSPFPFRAFGAARQNLQNHLVHGPGHEGVPDLVIVDYGPKHNPNLEWVYNPADWQDAHVLWARSINEEVDASLLEEFPHRKVWRMRSNGSFKPESMDLIREPVDH